MSSREGTKEGRKKSVIERERKGREICGIKNIFIIWTTSFLPFFLSLPYLFLFFPAIPFAILLFER